MSLRLPKCDFCKYLIEDDKTYRCKAFPGGIPDEKNNWDEEEECADGIKYEEGD